MSTNNYLTMGYETLNPIQLLIQNSIANNTGGALTNPYKLFNKNKDTIVKNPDLENVLWDNRPDSMREDNKKEKKWKPQRTDGGFNDYAGSAIKSRMRTPGLAGRRFTPIELETANRLRKNKLAMGQGIYGLLPKINKRGGMLS